MRWVKDRTGRFAQRPYFETQEMDYECEAFINSFLTSKYGNISFPISTNDITILLESEVADLDLYADLTEEGEGVEGVTDFIPGKKPKVRIHSELAEQERRENRLRTTLTHELGHVKFHNSLWTPMSQQLELGLQEPSGYSPRCKRDSIFDASPVDWMEWQAGYACGAFLMPITAVRKIANEFLRDTRGFAPLFSHPAEGQTLIQRVQSTFDVSNDAARVRLIKLNYITDHLPPTRPLPI